MPQLVLLGQPFPDCAREIRVLIRSAGAFVDQAALFEFGKRQTACGDGMVLIKHFVRLTIKENAPIPGFPELNCTLCANACGAVACNGVVPTRILVQDVESTYVFAKSLLRLCRRSQRVVKINILATIVSA